MVIKTLNINSESGHCIGNINIESTYPILWLQYEISQQIGFPISLKLHNDNLPSWSTCDTLNIEDQLTACINTSTWSLWERILKLAKSKNSLMSIAFNYNVIESTVSFINSSINTVISVDLLKYYANKKIDVLIKNTSDEDNINLWPISLPKSSRKFLDVISGVTNNISSERLIIDLVLDVTPESQIIESMIYSIRKFMNKENLWDHVYLVVNIYDTENLLYSECL